MYHMHLSNFDNLRKWKFILSWRHLSLICSFLVGKTEFVNIMYSSSCLPCEQDSILVRYTYAAAIGTFYWCTVHENHCCIQLSPCLEFTDLNSISVILATMCGHNGSQKLQYCLALESYWGLSSTFFLLFSVLLLQLTFAFFLLTQPFNETPWRLIKTILFIFLCHQIQ